MDAPLSRNQKAMRNVRKPETARSSVIATAAIVIDGEWSSTFSAGVASFGAMAVRGRLRAETAASAKYTDDQSTVADGPMRLRSSAGMAAAKPTSPATVPSLALASTSSSSPCTTLGTSALFATT